MTFVFFLIYLVLMYVRPYELYPELAPLRLMLVVGGLGLLVNLGSLPLTQFTFRAKQLWLVVAFALWISFSLVVALRWFGGAMQALDTFGITLVIFVLGVFSLNSEKRLRIALMMVVGLSLFLVLQDFLAVQFGVFRDLLVMDERQASGIVLARVRGTGFMKDPNDLAQSLVTAIPFTALAWRRGAVVQNLVLVVIPTAILLYGVYLTHSRGAIVSLLVILFIITRPKLGGVLSGLAVTVATLGIVAVTFGGRQIGLDQSAANRLEAWSTGLQLLKQHPLSGVGYNMFRDFNDLTAHNSFVLCFSELGLPGFFLWTALLVVTVMELNAIRKLPVTTEPDSFLRRYARSIQVAFYAFLVSAWFLSRTYIPTLYLLLALAISVAEMARRAGKTIGPFSFPAIAVRTMMIMMASLSLVYLQIRFQIR